MQRVNRFEVRPRSKRDELLLIELLDASASLWNELTYTRRDAFFSGKDIWQSDSDRYYSRYKGMIGSATAQQMERRNDEAWRSFFSRLENGEKVNPPGYWKEGTRRILQSTIRNDQYTIEWGKRSRLEIPIGLALKEKYGLGYSQRLRLEVSGNPRWEGKQGRLEIVYDRETDTFRARQPIKNAVLRRDTSLAAAPSDDEAAAALDIGANNLVAVTTTRGERRLYHGRPQFYRFHRTTERIASAQTALAPGTHKSKRISRLYAKRTKRRNHLQDALVRDLANWLRDRGIGEVVVGALNGVLSRHWSSRVNEKTHLFWAHGRFRRRLREVLGDEYDIEVREVDESGSSSRCPCCGGQNISRNKDAFRCSGCGFEGHSDLAGSENILQDHVSDRPMARPAVPDQNGFGRGHHEVPCLEWDDHRWRRHDRSTKEEPVNRSTHSMEKITTSDTGTA